MIGTPLQAIKFARQLDEAGNGEGANEFLLDWIEGFNAQKWSQYEEFCMANPDEQTLVATDGTTRQAHYGKDGRQPWDDIRDLGWGPEFCAGNALKYVRRDAAIKGVDRERDLKHARWYFARLLELVGNPQDSFTPNEKEVHAAKVFTELTELLTPVEVDLLENP